MSVSCLMNSVRPWRALFTFSTSPLVPAAVPCRNHPLCKAVLVPVGFDCPLSERVAKASLFAIGLPWRPEGSKQSFAEFAFSFVKTPFLSSSLRRAQGPVPLTAAQSWEDVFVPRHLQQVHGQHLAHRRRGRGWSRGSRGPALPHLSLPGRLEGVPNPTDLS